MLLAFGLPAQGQILEIRGGAGINGANADDFEDRVNATGAGGVDADEFDNFFADVFFNIPASPLGLGVRHEWLNQEDSGGGSEYDLKINNLSLLIDLRLIDSNIYLGPIVSIGYPWGELDFQSGSASLEDQIDGDRVSYSGGLEAGVIFGNFLIGAEAGYQSIKLKSDSSALRADIDVSGYYGKAMVGLAFF